MSPDDPVEKRVWRFLEEDGKGEKPQQGDAEGNLLKLGKYVLKREIGQGSTATVYEAEDQVLRRRVALKVLKEGASGLQGVARLHREAAIEAQLDHPGIVRIHEVDIVTDASGRPHHYIAMEFVEGKTLSEILSDRTADLKILLRILEDVARAVGYGHSKGIVHRDLKPGNVIVETSGRVVVTDFGLARGDMFDTRLTQTQAVLGTPMYMASEQVQGRNKEISARTDVYALGAILFEALTGRPPFEGTTIAELYGNIVQKDPMPVRKLNPSVPWELETIAQKALEKDPARRYPDANALADDLSRFRTGEPIHAQRPSVLYRFRRKIARYPGAFASAAAVLFVLVVAVAWLARVERSEREYSQSFQAGIEQWNRVTGLARRQELDRAAIGAMAEKAADQFVRAAGLSPGRPEPWLMIGRCRLVQGRAQEADEAWAQALQRDPTFALALFERAKYFAGTYARRRLRPVARVSRGKIVFGPQAAETPEDSPWRLKAEAELRDARGAKGLGAAEGKYLEGLLAFGAGRYKDAAGALKTYASENPWDAGAIAYLGLAHYSAADFESAEEDLSRALRMESHAAWIKARADVRFCLAKQDLAVDDYQSALKLDPEDADVYCNLGLALLEQGKLKEAERILTRAIELRPAFGRAYNSRGTLRVARKDLGGAQADFETAVLQDPLLAESYNNLGYVLAAKGEIEEAISEYDTALGLDAGYAEARRNRGFAKIMRGDLEGAIEDFRAAARLLPRDPDTLFALAQGLKLRGEAEEAVRRLREALDSAPEAWPQRKTARQLLQEWSGK